jgi:Tfp pilus assembly protein PilF
LLYLQQVEHQRPDLSFILQGEIFSPKHFSLVSTRRYPNIKQVTSDKPVTISTVDYFWLFARLNEKTHPLFWDPDRQYQKDFSEYLLPHGLLFTFHPSQQQATTPADLRTHWQLLSRSTNRILQGELEDSTTYSLSQKINTIAAYFRRLGDRDNSQKMYQASLAMRPDDPGTNNDYGALLMSQGELARALEHFNVVYNQSPITPMINKNLGMLMSHLGDNAQTVQFLERAITFGVHEGDVYVHLGQAYMNLGQLSPALPVLQAALQYYQKPTPENVSDEKLPAKIARLQEWLDDIAKQLQTGIQTR